MDHKRSPLTCSGPLDLSVRSYDPDATQRVLDENRYNDPPEDGHQFAIARVRFTSRSDAVLRADAQYRLSAVGVRFRGDGTRGG